MPWLRSIAGAVSPVGLLAGPIFQREVRASGRRRGTYWMRSLYAGGLLGITAVAFMGMREGMGQSGGVQRLQVLQQLAPYLTMVIIWFQFIALSLLAPVLTAPAVCDEKRARTLATLLVTPLTAAQIIFGKLTSRLVQLVILSLLAAPLLLAIRVFGGLEAEVILAASAITISTALLGAALGLMYSVWHRRATTATLFALFTLALCQGGPLGAAAINHAYARERGSNDEFNWRMLTTCAPATLGIVTSGMLAGDLPPGYAMTTGAPGSRLLTVRQAWAINAGYNAILALCIAAGSSLALRRVMFREGSVEGGGAAPKRSRRRKTPRPGAAPAGDTPPAVRESDRDREVSDRPVLWREIRQATFGSRKRLLLAFGIAAVVFVYLYTRVGLHEEGLHYSLAVIGAMAVLLQAAFLTTGGIAGEREARTWDVLMCTPLTPAEIITGKFIGALRAQWFVPCLAGAHMVVATASGQFHPVVLAHLALIWLGPALLLTATGVLFSLVFRRATMAAACNLFLALTLFAFSWLIAALFAWFFDLYWADWFEYIWDFCFAINPVPMSVSACTAAYDSAFRPGRSVIGPYELAEGNLTFRGFTFLAVGVFVGYAGAAMGALAIADRLFRRLAGRSS